MQVKTPRLLAAVLAWPVGQPTAAAGVLGAQDLLYAFIAVREATAGHPTIRIPVRRRGRR